ncbi:MAG: CRTAC1 family protein, partial [Gemmatimonadota bacterium]
PAASPPVTFVDVTDAAGLIFRHTNGSGGPAPKRYYIETMCGGVAFVDYDGDGHLDVYAVNGQNLADPLAPRAANQLFRNRGDGTFGDVTAATGAGDQGYGMGVTAGDYDNDGNADLYVTNYGRNTLLRGGHSRDGDGRVFADVTAAAGVGDTLWGVGAAFLDYDNDGDLDLYVANYLDYHLADADRQLRPYVARGTQGFSSMAYPHPDNFPGVPDVLYRNDGTGFTDVTRPAGVYNPAGKGMGMAVADYDDDGDVDVFVANDQTENFLWENRGDGTFLDVGLPSGTAYDRDGRLQSGMGADFGDYNADGRLDLFLTVYQAESNALYANEGHGLFTEAAFPAGLAIPSLPFVSWGNAFLDYDNDGRRDLFVANGHVLDNAEVFDSSSRYRMPDQLFRNLGPDGRGQWRFADVSGDVGSAVGSLHASRGAAAGDYDNDGDPDLLVLYLNERVALLRNDGGNAQHWIAVRAVGRESNRDGIGARVRVTADGLVQVDQVLAGGSYLSQSDLRLHFGLGGRTTVDQIRVQWPSGTVDHLGPMAADQVVTVSEGQTRR